MLPRGHRLAATTEIQAVVRSQQCITTPWVRLCYKTNSTQSATRFACVVGKKVHRLATVRHRHQRWLREVAQALIVVFPTPHDVVIVAQPSITTLVTPQQRAAAHTQLHQLLDKAVATGDN